jgi:type II secretory pathway pseudopilin PulG
MPAQKRNGFILTGMTVLLGVMSAAVLITINPAGQMARARDTRRRSDVFAIHNAVLIYFAENEKYPAGLTTPQETIEIGTCDKCVDLSSLAPTEIRSIPFDIEEGSPIHTGYFIKIEANGDLAITAKYAENEEVTSRVRK